MGGPPRSDMTPPMQMTAGPPLLVPASMQTAGAPHQYTYVPQANFPQVSLSLYNFQYCLQLFNFCNPSCVGYEAPSYNARLSN